MWTSYPRSASSSAIRAAVSRSSSMQRIHFRASDIGFFWSGRHPDEAAVVVTVVILDHSMRKKCHSLVRRVYHDPDFDLTCDPIAGITVRRNEAASLHQISPVVGVHLLLPADLFPRHVEHCAASRL